MDKKDISQELIVAVDNSPLADSYRTKIITAFSDVAVEATDLIEAAYQFDLENVEPDQLEGATAAARACRLKLVKLRTGLDRTRKALKQPYADVVKSIDSVAAIITKHAAEAELYVSQQEQFLAKIAQQKLNDLRDKRVAILKTFNHTPFLDVATMTEEDFQLLCTQVREAKELKDREAIVAARELELKKKEAALAKEKADLEAAEAAKVVIYKSEVVMDTPVAATPPAVVVDQDSGVEPDMEYYVDGFLQQLHTALTTAQLNANSEVMSREFRRVYRDTASLLRKTITFATDKFSNLNK